MNVNYFIPCVVLAINFFIMLIMLFSLLKLGKEIHKTTHEVHASRDQEESSYRLLTYYVVNLCLSLFLLALNTFSLCNHYLVYFQEGIKVTESATWLRFSDRYLMMFFVILNDVRFHKFMYEGFMALIKRGIKLRSQPTC